MRLTEFFRLRMPDGTDPVNIEDFNDNFEVIDKELKKRISSGESASDVTVEFETAESRQPLKSGEKLSVLMGKAHRFFTDLKTVAFSGKYGDLSERPTLGGAAGYKVADNDTTNSSEFLSTARVAYEHGLEIDALSRDLHALNDSGAIKGLDAREDGVYITYSPTGGADAVTKKLGSPTIKTKAVTGNGSFDAGGKVLFAGIQNAGLHIMTYAQKYGQGSHYSATCSYAGNMITYDQHAYGENTSGTDQYSMTIIYAVE